VTPYLSRMIEGPATGLPARSAGSHDRNRSASGWRKCLVCSPPFQALVLESLSPHGCLLSLINYRHGLFAKSSSMSPGTCGKNFHTLCKTETQRKCKKQKKLKKNKTARLRTPGPRESEHRKKSARIRDDGGASHLKDITEFGPAKK